MEGRCAAGQEALNKHLGLTYNQVPIHKAILSSNPDDHILWLHLDSPEVAKKVILRAANKKPANLSVKTWCPTIAYA